MANQTKVKVNTNGLSTNSSSPLAPNQPTPPPSKIAVNKKLLRLNTLGGQFTLFVIMCLVLTLGSLVAAFLVLATINSNLNELVNNSAPSILAAQQIGQAVEDADAKAADYQLYSRITLLGEQILDVKAAQQGAWNTILTRRHEAGDALFLARANITYPGEADTINTLNERWLAYVGRIDVMKDALDKGRWEEALAAYKSARDILVGNLGNANLDAGGRSPEEQAKLAGWPNFDPNRSYLGIEANIERLYIINLSYFNQARTQAFATLNLLTLLIIFFSLILVAGIALLYFRTIFITHRVINPGYLLALLLAGGSAFILITTLNQTRQDYQTIANDSFVSLQAIANIRQLAADANADESRLLLAPDGTKITSTNSALAPDVREAFRADFLTENFGKKQTQINAQLKVLFGNITFKGEFEALCKIAQNPAIRNPCPANSTFGLDEYLRFDRTIRDNFAQNNLGQAIKIDTGVSNEAFDRWDGALIELAKINQTEFNRSSCTSLGYLKFPPTCQTFGYNSAYLPLLQISIWVIFPLIALGVMGGFWFIRKEF